ncbi:MAG: 50S ribosomal protein L2 [Bacteroidota bacterium]
MPVKKLKPITPGTRFRLAPDFSLLTNSKPEKNLLISVKKTAGRNNTGKKTMHYRGGGSKKRMRIIDFGRSKHNIWGTVKTIEYDPMRSAYISLLWYEDGEKRYILYPKGLKVGDKVISGEQVDPEIGNAMPLKSIPMNTSVHNIALDPNKHGIMVRSAGASAELVGKEGKYVVIKLPSGEVRKILGTCMATVGTVGNVDHSNVRLGKAGRKRNMGRLPRVRAVAKNPVDHPMGGGEGKASGGIPRSKNGIPAKGKRTRSLKKASNKLIIKRRK